MLKIFLASIHLVACHFVIDEDVLTIHHAAGLHWQAMVSLFHCVTNIFCWMVASDWYNTNLTYGWWVLIVSIVCIVRTSTVLFV